MRHSRQHPGDGAGARRPACAFSPSARRRACKVHRIFPTMTELGYPMNCGLVRRAWCRRRRRVRSSISSIPGSARWWRPTRLRAFLEPASPAIRWSARRSRAGAVPAADQGVGRLRAAGEDRAAGLAHVPEKWIPVFRKGHAQNVNSKKEGQSALRSPIGKRSGWPPQGDCTTSSFTFATPFPVIPSDLGGGGPTSTTRPGHKGPRSLTRTVTDCPVATLVTRSLVPNGSVRCGW